MLRNTASIAAHQRVVTEHPPMMMFWITILYVGATALVSARRLRARDPIFWTVFVAVGLGYCGVVTFDNYRSMRELGVFGLAGNGRYFFPVLPLLVGAAAKVLEASHPITNALQAKSLIVAIDERRPPARVPKLLHVIVAVRLFLSSSTGVRT